jgi:hypothetical protein
VPTIVIVSFPADAFALAQTLQTLPDVAFECERIVESGDDAIMPLVWARGADPEVLEAAFADDPTVREVSRVAEFDGELLYRMEWVDHISVLLRMLTHADATVLDAYGRADEWRLRVMFPTRDGLSATHEFCRDHGFDLDVESVREMAGEPAGRYGLTDDQYDALVRAVQRGYYDVPKRVSLSALADEVGISHQALSERLRRGVEALVTDTLLVAEPPSPSTAMRTPQEA